MVLGKVRIFFSTHQNGTGTVPPPFPRWQQSFGTVFEVMHKCLTPLLRDEVRLRADRAFWRGGIGLMKEFQEPREAMQIPVPSLGCQG